MQYCFVENKKIIEGPKIKPKNWKYKKHNITRLDLMSDSELKKIGWLPVNDLTPIFDKETQKLGPIVLTVEESQVVKIRKVISLTLDEKTNRWKNEMSQTDKTLPRWAEDLYDALDPETEARLSTHENGFKSKVAAKKAKRAAKPK